MKSTGIVRKIDELGRIVIPKELRLTLNIDERAPMEIFVKENQIILMKHEPSCIFCGSDEGNSEFKGKNICKSCISDIAK
ncbi:MAG: AbrB/MazE/SpoVT family DNA-binding domain-containing protein [Oscillospiraceae bacterium]|nr:AbrB/MazE/SpoVT family DNA-binding domain-containing protein [Oscillospiraceae bacterium]